MIAQILDRTLACFRVGDPRGAYPVFDATGSTISPGRWNGSNCPMIYACEHYSTALLEKLAHGGGVMPPNQHFIKITIPRGSTYEVVSQPALPGWDDPKPVASKTFGEQWCEEKRSLILIVPSVIARLDRNILINPAHPDFPNIETSLHEPVYWDARLFVAGS